MSLIQSVGNRLNFSQIPTARVCLPTQNAASSGIHPFLLSFLILPLLLLFPLFPTFPPPPPFLLSLSNKVRMSKMKLSFWQITGIVVSSWRIGPSLILHLVWWLWNNAEGRAAWAYTYNVNDLFLCTKHTQGKRTIRSPGMFSKMSFIVFF